MNQPEEPGHVEPITLDELTWLLAGELSEAEEADLRMRMTRDPQATATLDRLRGATEPCTTAVPEEMPPDVTDRLRAHLAELGRRRAEGLPPMKPEQDPDGEV